ncbi:hypothetical protein HKD37_12G034253 [Glycine soja]
MQQSKELKAKKKVPIGENCASSVPRNPEVTNQTTPSNMASTDMFNIIQQIGSQMGFSPRPLVANTNYMPININNMFVATLGRKPSANDNANRVGLAKKPLNVVGPIGLSNVTLLVSLSGGIN